MEIKDNNKMSAGLMNKINKRQVLAVIRQENQISRSGIVRKLGLTAPTVNRILNHLHEDGFVEYLGHGKSDGGRPPMIVKFNGKDNYVIGIDVGATTIRGVLSNLNAEFVKEIQLSTKLRGGEEAILDQIVDLVNKLLSQAGNDESRVLGIGIGVPGLVDRKNGNVDFSPDFGWKNFAFEKRLKERLSLPLLFDNSTRLMALGEMKYGKGVVHDDYFLINVGYGIAAGIVVNGKLITGALGHAGEFGHIVIEPESHVRCECGGTGHLEALASGRRIADLGKELMKTNPRHGLASLTNGNPDQVNAKMIAALAREGDEECTRIFNSALHYLAIGIVNMANVFDPKTVFVGGGVALNGEIFFDNLRKYIHERRMGTKTISVEPTTFGENATIVGACALVLEAVLNFEIHVNGHITESVQ